jgi:hypothetical protein
VLQLLQHITTPRRAATVALKRLRDSMKRADRDAGAVCGSGAVGLTETPGDRMWDYRRRRRVAGQRRRPVRLLEGNEVAVLRFVRAVTVPARLSVCICGFVLVHERRARKSRVANRRGRARSVSVQSSIARIVRQEMVSSRRGDSDILCPACHMMNEK